MKIEYVVLDEKLTFEDVRKNEVLLPEYRRERSDGTALRRTSCVRW
ncbi:MAG: hypothetical protein IJ171_09015 [Ruminococcus sp.]|nr:hypothetical protein [Ruminococcus sp.]